MIAPGCTGNNYLNSKLAIIYMILRVHTIAAFLALVVGIIMLVLITKLYCHCKSIDQVELISE